MTISFVIVSNRWNALLEALLSSVLTQDTDRPYELVLVNNGFDRKHEDFLLTIPEKNRLATTQVLYEPRPGKIFGIKLGFEHCRGEYVSLLDDDNSIGSGFLASVYEALCRHPGVGGISPDILPRWQKSPPEWLEEVGFQCLSYNVKDETEIVPDREVRFDTRTNHNLGMPPGGGMIVHRDLSSRMSRLPDEVLELYPLSFDMELWFGLKVLSRFAVRTSRIQLHHHVPETRTGLPYLLAFNYRKMNRYSRIVSARGTPELRRGLLPASVRYVLSTLLQFFAGKQHAATTIVRCARGFGMFQGAVAGSLTKRGIKADELWS